MAKYTKRQIIVDAEIYHVGMEDGFDDIETAINSGLNIDNYEKPVNINKIPFIQTLEGKHYISNGDYIITGIEGERYPCKKAIFHRTYTMVSDE